MCSLTKRTAFVKVFAATLLFLFVGVQAVSAQVRQDTDKKQESAENKIEVPLISIELVGGGRLQVEELRETSDGIWYKQGGVTTLLDPKRVARIERSSSDQPGRSARLLKIRSLGRLPMLRRWKTFSSLSSVVPYLHRRLDNRTLTIVGDSITARVWMLGFIRIASRELPSLHSCEPKKFHSSCFDKPFPA
jgi:hypothetical protein